MIKDGRDSAERETLTRGWRWSAWVSNDASNRNLNRVQGVPITGNAAHVYPGEAAIEVNGEPRRAMAARLRRSASSASSPNWPPCRWMTSGCNSASSVTWQASPRTPQRETAPDHSRRLANYSTPVFNDLPLEPAVGRLPGSYLVPDEQGAGLRSGCRLTRHKKFAQPNFLCKWFSKNRLNSNNSFGTNGDRTRAGSRVPAPPARLWRSASGWRWKPDFRTRRAKTSGGICRLH